MKLRIIVFRLISILTFIAKYSVILYAIAQVVSGYGTNPPTLYYYPLLVLLMVALSKVQNTFNRMANYYVEKLGGING